MNFHKFYTINSSLLQNSYDKSADLYDNRFQKLQYLKYQKLLNYLNISSNARILDLGCGTGMLYDYLKKYLHCTYNVNISDSSCNHLKYYGIDISAKMLEHAKRRGVYTCQGNFARMPYRNNFFDYVISVTAIGLTTDSLSDIIDEISRVTKVYSFLAISVLQKCYSNRILDLLVQKCYSVQEYGIECGQDVGIIARREK